MGVKVYIDGEVVNKAQAVVPVFDRGFLYGDSVYEVMRTAGGKPVELGAHLARLRRSAQSIELAIPDDAELAAAIGETLAAAANPESYLRVIVTRGAGEIGLDPALADRPRTIVLVKPLALPSAEQVEHGVSLWIVGVERTSRRAIDPSVKSGNYLNNILGLAEARRAGAYECLMCDARGRIAEGSSSNVFVVVEGALVTPDLEIGLLPGITRQRVLALAGQAGIPFREGTLVPGEVRGADEVFITSSIRGVLPVSRVDEVDIPAPGPITQRVRALYERFLVAAAREAAGA